MPDEDLELLEPSDLNDRDLRLWYWGIRVEAAHRYLVIVNSSYSKSEIARRKIEEGLEDVEVLLDEGTREACDGVTKYLSS